MQCGVLRRVCGMVRGYGVARECGVVRGCGVVRECGVVRGCGVVHGCVQKACQTRRATLAIWVR